MGEVTRVEFVPEPTGPDAPPPPATDRPAWLPEKFKSPEDLAKAYSELERKQGTAGREEAPPPAAEDTPPAATDTPPEKVPGDQKVEADLAAKGIDYDALATEVQTAGALSEASYAKLEAAGIPKALVDDYIGSKRAEGERIVADLYAEVGGEEQAKAMLAWAATGYSKEQIAAFNKASATGSMAELQAQVRALKVAYEAANGKEPAYLDTPRVGAGGGGVYRSQAEWLADIANPKYKTDPAFRQDVVDKLSRSRI